MALRVDIYSLSDGTEKIVRSYFERDGGVQDNDGNLITEIYVTPDGEIHSPIEDPDDYLENLYRELRGSYTWAGHAYEEDELPAGLEKA